MYVVFLKSVQKDTPSEVVDAHREYLQTLLKEQKIVSAGPLEQIGGMVLYQTASKEETIELVKQDPFIAQGYRDYEVLEWKITVG